MTDQPANPPPSAMPASEPPSVSAPPPAPPPPRPSAWPLAISILALAVATCAAALSLWQFSLMRETQSLSGRPFVHVSGPQVTTVPQPQDRTGNAMAITAVLTNSGTSATRDMRFFMRCVTSREPVAEPWTLLFQAKIEKLPLIIGPHANATARCAFDPEQLRGIADGTLSGYVLGDITYRDRFDGEMLFRTQFSWQLTDVRVEPGSGQIALTAVPHGEHNCADEECPLAIMTR